MIAFFVYVLQVVLELGLYKLPSLYITCYTWKQYAASHDTMTFYVYTPPWLYLSALLQMEFGVVYSCLEDKMFTARRGKGAFCNGEPLQVSDQEG